MGMRLKYVSISDQAADSLRANPSAAMELLYDGMYAQLSGHGPGDGVSFFAAIFGGGRQGATKVHGPVGGPRVRSDAVRGGLEKAWHGLHYIFCGQAEPIPCDPRSALLDAAPLTPGDDSAGLLSAARVRQFRDAVFEITDEQFDRRFDLAAFAANGIYPDIWDEDRNELKEEYYEYFRLLKHDLNATVAAGEGLLVSID